MAVLSDAGVFSITGRYLAKGAQALVAAALCIAIPTLAAEVLSPPPVFHQDSSTGTPAIGYKLFTYQAGTTTKQTTYVARGGAANTNPIILDSNGNANVWLDPTKNYKLVFTVPTETDPPGSSVWTVDNVRGPLISPITSTGDLIIGNGTNSETRLPIGANRTVLTSNGTTASWQAPAVVQYTCLNTSADQTNIDAIVTALKAANGGTVQLSAGTCLFDGIETTAGGEAPRVNFTGTGEYGATNVQATGRANYVFKLGDFSTITNMRIKGASGNLGGIQITPSSTAFVQHVEINGFSGSSWAIDVDGTTGNGALRSLLDHVYVIGNSKSLRLRGTVNDFKMNNSTISGGDSTAAGSFISAEGGSNVDAYFNNFDFASSVAAEPIKCTTPGRITFDKGGVENMAIGTAPGATVTSAKVFSFENPCRIEIYNTIFSGFLTQQYTYAGTGPTFVATGTDNSAADIVNVQFVQVENPGAVRIRFMNLNGVSMRASIRNNDISCINCSSLAQVQEIFTNGINVDFGPKFGDISNNITRASGFGYAPVWGFKQQLGTLTAAATSTGTNTVLDSLTLPKNSFWKSRSLVWKGCGKAVGAVGSKTIDFKFDAGGATTYNVATSATAQDWCSTVTIYFNDFTTQSVNVNGLVGTTPIMSVTAASKATDVNAPVFSILGTAGGGDTVTLTSSYWEMQ